ncbi:MAG: winged helix-turn-helix transcriptional regulator [Thermoleophilia bacterium]
MLPRVYENQDCSIARALEAVGERWTLLIVREALNGTRRFDEFQSRLGIARNVLTARLQRLVEEGILERRPYQEHPARFEYLPTRKGEELLPVTLALLAWGDRYYADPVDGPPVVLRHDPCGGDLSPRTVCSCCGGEASAATVSTRIDRTRPAA